MSTFSCPCMCCNHMGSAAVECDSARCSLQAQSQSKLWPLDKMASWHSSQGALPCMQPSMSQYRSALSTCGRQPQNESVTCLGLDL
eukprot:1161139-Pelagomonas_calceolata.AAC.2